MPTLEQISYSREATIAAFNDYYQFLTTMYLPEDAGEKPPVEGGYWPSITKEKVQLLGKNNEVFELMRRLSYLPDEAFLVAFAKAAHWPSILEGPMSSQLELEQTRLISEGFYWQDIPSSAFSIAAYGHDNDEIILDTQFGLIYWLETPDWIQNDPIKEPFLDTELLRMYTPNNEHDWREHTAWAIADFFEVLKNELRLLKSVPITCTHIEGWHEPEQDFFQCKAGLEIYFVRRTYQMYGWPDLSVYDKDSCQEAVERLIESWQEFCL
ncbi:unnamed protein product [Aureobasidium mustum]|uniref:Uncharacterized protein n=1 Tax=Aureobasidium mustum TaxID=2773714 RepID=A0A9N8PHK8_9PEZI|nr:unnamed protein product [Aureobasidium mustum]